MTIDRTDIERVTLVVFGLLVPVALGTSLTIFNDGDVRWHIAAGQWMIEHRAVPRVDPFSFTFAGQPWMAFEWGSQLIYASAYRLAGPLILAGIRPHIDGRSDMYGDAFFADYQRILDGDRTAFDRANARYDLAWTMIAPRYGTLIDRLD